MSGISSDEGQGGIGGEAQRDAAGRRGGAARRGGVTRREAGRPVVLLVKPPEVSGFNFGAFSLAAVAAAVRDRARVSILDATDLPLDEAVAAAASGRPDVVGVTAMGLTSVGPVAAFVRRLREGGGAATGTGAARRATVVVGGHGAAMVPGMLLAAGADAVVMGEGELTFRELLVRGIRPGAPGLACLDGGRVVTGPPRPPILPLDSIRPPARDLMPPPPDGVHLMETSRGCPHACAFCETTRFHGRRWRPHSPQRVAAEVRRLVEGHGAWMIHFADDNFTASPRRVLEICDRLPRVPLPAFIMASARGDDLVADPALVPALARARILRITVGVETLEGEVARGAGKPIPLDIYREAFRRLAEQGIFSVASFIVGLPGESPDMRRRAAELAVEAGPDSAHFLPFLPLPGTPLGEGRPGPDPDPADVRDAARLNDAFCRHPAVRERLAGAAGGGGVRGLLAAATLRRFGGASLGPGEVAP